MKTIENEMPSFSKPAKAFIKNQFGMESEFILHDWSKVATIV